METTNNNLNGLTDSPDVFNNELFKNGFIDDITPLDDTTLTVLVSGILANKKTIENGVSSLDGGLSELRLNIYKDFEDEIGEISRVKEELSGNVYKKDYIDDKLNEMKDSVYTKEEVESNFSDHFDIIVIDGGNATNANNKDW